MPIKDFERLASTALKLPTRQRAKLAQALWDSIDSKPTDVPLNKETLAQIKRRDREMSEGNIRCRTHAQVMRAARKAAGCSK
jgi:putative addiction module component (TIGR02574 family)